MPGVATGLAWTPVGGDILFIESTRMPGSSKLILTGQLGDVMKESARAALSLLRSRASALSIEPGLFERSDIHVHIPAGAIPKDGPSAGVAMFMSLCSLMLGRAVDPAIAMTGEISLRGVVLPVGGIREKVVAAERAGITTVMLPARNRLDYDDIPASTRDRLHFVWLEFHWHFAQSGPDQGAAPVAGDDARDDQLAVTAIEATHGLCGDGSSGVERGPPAGCPRRRRTAARVAAATAATIIPAATAAAEAAIAAPRAASSGVAASGVAATRCASEAVAAVAVDAGATATAIE
jgi:hypothetical protein